MPCRTDEPTQAEIEATNRARRERSQATQNQLDEQAREICRLRGIIIMMHEGTHPDDFEEIYDAQLNHRRFDQARFIEEKTQALMETSMNKKLNPSMRSGTLKAIAAASSLSDEELLTTDLF